MDWVVPPAYERNLMPGRPRNFVPGAIYHATCRVARGDDRRLPADLRALEIDDAEAAQQPEAETRRDLDQCQERP